MIQPHALSAPLKFPQSTISARRVARDAHLRGLNRAFLAVLASAFLWGVMALGLWQIGRIAFDQASGIADVIDRAASQ